MSRAFVKEDSDVPEELPERAVSPLPNYMTPQGHRRMQHTLERLLEEKERLNVASTLEAQAQLPVLERDIRYFQTRLKSARIVEPVKEHPDRVMFGRLVSFSDAAGHQYRYRIVGEDEALESSETQLPVVSWASPLAKALLGAEVGDTTLWQKPSGQVEIEIVDVAE